ncbi:tRNA pseudouridine(55) synthase TruB [Alteribacillus sp. YIM 98480]|uniref:tRNA pseudouridine(55) synthase TruB n=1 Tax=Alteribacillus sp. YIM 98480 TaxID=2606599 RepID=UPI00131C3122|nr:tRNA pseudouridine(55) synthase TruB [Alteribacillus sp. YIM 98480]
MLNGIVPLYKRKGMTSHDCVTKLRRMYETKKVGHTGTLDPDVEGVLPICIGKATKISEYITSLQKQYEAEITLGYSTTTEDASGDIVEKKPVNSLMDKDEIEKALHQFYGKQQQTPPIYSAVKVKGKKLYEYAREGIEVERPSKTIEIYDLTLDSESIEQSGQNVSFRFTVTCSKGTYIRTLAADIGKYLGYPAHMSYLKRTKSGPFSSQECYTLEELNEKKERGMLDETIAPMSKALQHVEHIEVDEITAQKILNGSVLPKSIKTNDSIFLLIYKGESLAIYQDHPKKPGLIKPKTMLKSK